MPGANKPSNHETTIRFHNEKTIALFADIANKTSTFTIQNKPRHRMSTLSPKTALVTGSTRGIGRAISRALALQGYQLILIASNESRLSRLKEELQAMNTTSVIETITCDFANDNDLAFLLNKLAYHPTTIDILINNAGIYRPISILDESSEDYTLQMKVNYHAPHVLCKFIGNKMRENKKGHILNITSTASRTPVENAGTYTVTKYALMGLTHVLRASLQPHGVKVTEIIPGSTLTSSWEGTEIPAERFVLPEDIAASVLLCLQLSEGANIDEIVVKPKFGNI